MKKALITLSTAIYIVGAILTSCNTPTNKVEDAKEKVSEAKKDLDQATEEYQIEIENYRKETAIKISENNKTIADFKVKIEHEKKDVKAEYEKKIIQLEQKNKELKQKMDNYKAEGKEKWETFKTEFNHDMEELGKAFKDLTVNNVK